MIAMKLIAGNYVDYCKHAFRKVYNARAQMCIVSALLLLTTLAQKPFTLSKTDFYLIGAWVGMFANYVLLSLTNVIILRYSIHSEIIFLVIASCWLNELKIRASLCISQTISSGDSKTVLPGGVQEQK
jgi:hypothetical protein